MWEMKKNWSKASEIELNQDIFFECRTKGTWWPINYMWSAMLGNPN